MLRSPSRLPSVRRWRLKLVKVMVKEKISLATDGDIMRSYPLQMLKRACWPNLRRSHWLRHPVKDHHALAAAAGRERLGRRVSDAVVNVLPVIHGPHVAGGIYSDIG